MQNFKGVLELEAAGGCYWKTAASISASATVASKVVERLGTIKVHDFLPNTMRRNSLNCCILVSISKNVVS